MRAHSGCCSHQAVSCEPQWGCRQKRHAYARPSRSKRSYCKRTRQQGPGESLIRLWDVLSASSYGSTLPHFCEGDCWIGTKARSGVDRHLRPRLRCRLDPGAYHCPQCLKASTTVRSNAATTASRLGPTVLCDHRSDHSPSLAAFLGNAGGGLQQVRPAAHPGLLHGLQRHSSRLRSDWFGQDAHDGQRRSAPRGPCLHR